jgi:hypothetical protein
VPKTGGNLFTGSGSSTTADPFATLVTIPAAPTYTANAQINESPFSLPEGCVSFATCYLSVVTVPGSFDYLQIVRRQDASTIPSGLKIGTVQIWYDGSDEVGDNFHGYLGLCPSPTTPLSDRPCIASTKYYKNKGVAGWTPDLDGDFEWTIITKKNGGFKVGA